jgi:hypothetical protein
MPHFFFAKTPGSNSVCLYISSALLAELNELVSQNDGLEINLASQLISDTWGFSAGSKAPSYRYRVFYNGKTAMSKTAKFLSLLVPSLNQSMNFEIVEL